MTESSVIVSQLMERTDIALLGKPLVWKALSLSAVVDHLSLVCLAPSSQHLTLK